MIAAVNGYALGGGCELVLACDLAIASEGATFGQPEVTLGIMPGGGATQVLPPLIGKPKAMELLLTGRRFSAREAHELGVVNKVVPDDRLEDEAMALASTIAERPAIAVRLIKEAVRGALEGTSLTRGLAHERQSFYLSYATRDKEEGMRAFVEKRSPHFRGE